MFGAASKRNFSALCVVAFGQLTAFGKYVLMLTALLLVACTTNIKPMDATQTPPSAGFGTFTPVLLKPIANQTPQDFPPNAVALVQSRLESCLSEILAVCASTSESGDTQSNACRISTVPKHRLSD